VTVPGHARLLRKIQWHEQMLKLRAVGQVDEGLEESGHARKLLFAGGVDELIKLLGPGRRVEDVQP
jgi:hypothetical protein